MKLFDLITMCLSNLTRRKVRTLLTVVGVVVGTCAIVVMISLGVAMKKNQEDMLAQMGDLTVIQVYNYNQNADTPDLDDEAVAKMNALEGVDVATPFWRPPANFKLFAGKNDRYEMDLWSIVGVYPEALEKFGYQLHEGKWLKDGERDFTVMVGQSTAYNFRDMKRKNSSTGGYMWNNPDPITGEIPKPYVDLFKDEIRLETVMDDEEKDKPVIREVKVVGSIVEDWSKGYETSQGVFVDIDKLKALVKEYNRAAGIKGSSAEQKNYDDVRVRVTDLSLVDEVEQKIQDMGYETYSMETVRKPMEEDARRQQFMLGGLGFISLFVAAIGITNTMVMSIYERTREIGVMKVLGCKLGNIRTVFLMEAGLIGFLGGVMGVGISYAISAGLNYISTLGMMGDSSSAMMSMMMGGMGMGGGGQISIIPSWLVGLAMIFATCIGLISGFYPANRAVKISALEAIKHE